MILLHYYSMNMKDKQCFANEKNGKWITKRDKGFEEDTMFCKESLVGKFLNWLIL